MSIPQVAIIGRPNVGKSSILNWFAQARLAVVDDQAGVTRDRVSHLLCHREHYFEVVDTGGVGIEDVDNLTQEVEDQIALAIELASVILFVVDTQTGLLPLDQEVAKRLRYVKVPVVCVANKTDHEGLDTEAMEAEYPGEAPERMMGIRTRPFLLHLVWHIGWHLGHIYYHRLGGETAG